MNLLEFQMESVISCYRVDKIMTELAIRIGDVYSSFHTDDKEIVALIKETCSFEKDNWEFAREQWIKKARSAGDDWQLERALEWDGTISLLHGRSFPTGLMQKVAVRMALNNVSMTITDERIMPDALGPSLQMSKAFEERRYQKDALDALLSHGGRGIIKSPTGSGKTIMASMLIARLHVPTLIIVDKLVLIDQWKNAIEEMVILPKTFDDKGKQTSNYVGVVKGGTYDPSIITIASVQTLMSMKKRKKMEWKNFVGLHPTGWGLVIEDECHHLGADGRYAVNMSIPAYYRVGYSATPQDRIDANLRVVAALGPVVFELPAENLIEQGMLAKPIITFEPVDRMYFDQWTKYIDVYRDAIVRNTNRNKTIVDLAKEHAMKNKKVLIFVDFIEHGEILEAMLRQEEITHIDDEPGMESAFVFGDDKDRDLKFEMFKMPNGTLDVLVATEGLIGEGFDYKGIDVVIVADGGKSAIQTIQKIGRGMRVLEDKKEVRIFDFADRCKYLSDHARERHKVWSNLGFDVTTPRYMDV
jgi:superfamily II DNA or RNA helicase